MGDFNSGIEDPPSMMMLNRNPDSKAHPHRFKEVHREKLISEQLTTADAEIDANLRIKHYPTIITHHFVYSIDLLFFTADNMALKGVGTPMPEDIESDIKWTEKCTKRIEEWEESGKQTNKNGQMHLADFNDLWALPNHRVPSDHLPVCGLFEMKSLCQAQLGGNEECRCCREQVKKKKMSKKERKEMKRKNKQNKQKTQDMDWKVHEMTSF